MEGTHFTHAFLNCIYHFKLSRPTIFTDWFLLSDITSGMLEKIGRSAGNSYCWKQKHRLFHQDPNRINRFRMCWSVTQMCFTLILLWAYRHYQILVNMGLLFSKLWGLFTNEGKLRYSFSFASRPCSAPRKVERTVRSIAKFIVQLHCGGGLGYPVCVYPTLGHKTMK